MNLWRWGLVTACLATIAALPLALIENPRLAWAAVVGGVCLILWLSEAVPPYVPTFVLWALTPLFLGPLGEEFGLRRVLGWSADPVLALCCLLISLTGPFVLGLLGIP